MKIILSRKGFDSGTGGVPSPILPDGTYFSLPIPGGSPFSYDQVASPLERPLGQVVRELTGGRMGGREPAHLDPDLWAGAMPRREGWRPSLGQTGAAQSHLAGQGVGIGDVFLFFGWFRDAQDTPEGLAFVRGAPQQHCLFGYLQVGESLVMGSRPDKASALAQRPWLAGHPHLGAGRAENNTIHLASDRLVIDGVDTGLPGAGAFSRLDPTLVLTNPGGPKSVWRLPGWMGPGKGKTGLSYHAAPERWRPDGDQVLLNSVAKGQEFVLDCADRPQAGSWVESMVRAGLGLEAKRAPAVARKRRMMA